jgi:ATP-dependent DNA helicase RecG
MDPVRVAAYVQNSTDPPLGVEVRLETIDGHPVFRIDVPVAMPGPVATRDGYYTKRVLDTLGHPQCVPISPQEIVSMGMVTRGQDYAAAVAVGATLEDLDPVEFDRYRRLCALTGDSTATLKDEDILKALGLVPIGSPVSLGALLLFGRAAALARWVPNAEFIFQDLRKAQSATNERIVGPLLHVAQTLQALIDVRNSV